jgi:uncharacterized protein YgiB involved in biofilm formation
MTYPKPGRIYPDRETAKEIRDAAKREAYEDAAKIAEDCESEYGGYQCDVAAAIRSRMEDN